MVPGRRGSFHLFHLAGIDVRIHWQWFAFAAFQILYPRPADMEYTDQYRLLWRAAEFLSIFGIVVMHEFGHALACRQVGGKANLIVLWLLGGVAYASPPPRPGAVLWTIAAGPLVNVMLIPVTIGLYMLGNHVLGWGATLPDVNHFLGNLAWANGALLILNMLPIYPLDGGQILQSLLWFVVGRSTSLMVASILGMVAGAGLLGLFLLASVLAGDVRGVILPLLLLSFVVRQSWAGIQYARALMKLEQAPRYGDLACPNCGAAPLKGEFWGCADCGTRFDTFVEDGTCPGCGKAFHKVQCLGCGQSFPHNEWFPAAIEMGEPV
jgi:Zn-dependent protease